MSKRKSLFCMYAVLAVWGILCGALGVSIVNSYKQAGVVLLGYLCGYATYLIGTTTRKDT